MNLGTVLKKGHNCGLCRQHGHFQNKYPKIFTYGEGVLPLGNLVIRQELISRLYSLNGSISHRGANDPRLVMTTIPSAIKGIIIFKRLLINNDLIHHLVVQNICVECTFIVDYGDEHPLYRKPLFTIGCVTGCITSTGTKHINSLV